jgi:hypothetical protein
VTYRLTPQPNGPGEYRVDSQRAEIVFGTPPPAGARIEVTHWTSVANQIPPGGRYGGVLDLALHAENAGQLADLCRLFERALLLQAQLFANRGFAALEPSSLAPARRSEGVGWFQRLTYRFAFDFEIPDLVTEGLPIRRIDVNLRRQAGESLTVT